MPRVLLFIVSWAAVQAFAQPELSGSPSELRQFIHPAGNLVTITGSAEETAYSDTAIVSLIITTKKDLLSESIAVNADLREQVTQVLVESGVASDSIKSSKFSSSPQYGWFGKKPSSYEVVNRMAITIDDTNHLTAIAEVADRYSEVELSGTEFNHSKKYEFNQLVREKALNDILAQKAFYEESLGVTLTAIGFRDFRVQETATRGGFMLEEVMVTARRVEQDYYSSAKEVYIPDAQPSFDEIQYQANLTVEFEIE